QRPRRVGPERAGGLLEGLPRRRPVGRGAAVGPPRPGGPEPLRPLGEGLGLVGARLLRRPRPQRGPGGGAVEPPGAPREEERRDDEEHADEREDRPVLPGIRRVGSLFHVRSSREARATAATASRSASTARGGTSRSPSARAPRRRGRGRPGSGAGA